MMGRLLSSRTRKTLAFATLSSLTVTLLAFAAIVSANQQERPRRTERSITPTSSPTPVPASTTNQTPTPPSAQPPAQAPTPRSTPTSSGAPKLGDAPPPPTLRPRPTPKLEDQEVEAGDVIKINTNLVTLNVRVIDRANRPLNNVRQTDLHVYEDGVPQTIEFFSKQEVPVSYGLAVDTSLSLRNQIQSVIDASKIIINSNKPGDETFIERFISSDKINVERDFTANKDELLDAVDNLYLEGGQTAVLDGVYLAAEHVAEHKKGDDSDRRRRALIVITDGEDRHSYYTEPQLMQRLREEDVQIYVIGFVNELEQDSGFIKKSPREKAVKLLEQLAKETGGRAFFPNSLSELPQIAQDITRDLRTQYLIGYNPTNKARDGSYRAIRVTVDSTASDDRRLALTRPGYTAPRGESLRPNPPGTRPQTSTAERKPRN